MSARRPLVHHLLRRVFGLALDVYYRGEHTGEEVPPDGPVILVANHPNGLVDPLVLASTTARTVRFLGKAPLFDMPVIGALMRGFRALPVYRAQDGADTAQNERTFEAVYSALESGDLICLFPEGKSHDEPSLQRLKTGAARMALGAEARNGFALGVRVVPVGLVYRAKRRFRSRVATCIGTPIDARELRQLHERDEREAARTLTARIAEGLELVTLRLDRWEDLPLIELAAEVFRPDEHGRLTYLLEFADAVAALRSRADASTLARIDELAGRVAAFRERLRALGLRASNLHARYRTGAVLRFCLRNVLALFLFVPLAGLGVVLWFLPYRLVPVLASFARPSRDVFATVHILAGAVLFPLWWALSTALAWSRSPFAGWTALAALPVLGILALAYRDWREEVFRDAAAFLRLARRRRLRELLIRDRDAIASEVGALRDELLAGAT